MDRARRGGLTGQSSIVGMVVRNLFEVQDALVVCFVVIGMRLLYLTRYNTWILPISSELLPCNVVHISPIVHDTYFMKCEGGAEPQTLNGLHAAVTVSTNAKTAQ